MGVLYKTITPSTDIMRSIIYKLKNIFFNFHKTINMLITAVKSILTAKLQFWHFGCFFPAPEMTAL